MPNASTLAFTAASKLYDSVRLYTQLYLAAGTTLLVSLMIASYMQASTGLTAIHQIEQANIQASHLDRLQKLILDSQTSVRGYLLTHDPQYLQPYREARPKIAEVTRLIEQDRTPSVPATDAKYLLDTAHGVLASLDIMLKEVSPQPVPLQSEKAWLDHGRSVMATYRNEHAKLVATLQNDNLSYVEQSISNFRKARIVTVLLAIASLLLLAMTIMQGLRNQELQRRVTQLLQEERDELEREVALRTQELTNLASYLTDIREKEKHDLARELHDEMGALLTAAKLDADWIERRLPPDLRESMETRLRRLRETLSDGIRLKRRITNDLRPALLYDLGLVEALRVQAGEFSDGSEIELKLDLPEDEPKLPEAVSICLFRIVQEAFTNIRKYAQAHRVKLSLRVTGEAVDLAVEDDGVGFDTGGRTVGRHGLAGIKHRVFSRGGTLLIRSAPGAGTSLRVSLPVVPPEAGST